MEEGEEGRGEEERAGGGREGWGESYTGLPSSICFLFFFFKLFDCFSAGVGAFVGLFFWARISYLPFFGDLYFLFFRGSVFQYLLFWGHTGRTELFLNRLGIGKRWANDDYSFGFIFIGKGRLVFL